MRVLFVIDTLGEGGTERSLADQIEPLAKHDVDAEIAIIRSRGDEGVEAELRARGVPIHDLGDRGTIRDAVALRTLVRSGRFDLVHSMLYAANLRARLVRGSTTIPLVNSFVNVTFARDRSIVDRKARAKRRAAALLDAVTARRVDAFHAVSESAALDATEGLRLRPERVTVIGRARDRSRLGGPSAGRTTRAREAFGVEADEAVVVSIGRQEPNKDQGTLLRAFAHVLEVRPDVVLLIAGREGTSTRALNELHEELRLDDRVRFLGHRQDVGDVLAAGDLFVLASLFEGMPGAVLEAMALGLPIVATDIAPTAEVIHDGLTGELVPPGQPSAMAAVVLELLGDADRRRRLGDAGRSWFEEHVSIDVVAARHAEFYRRLLDGRRDGAAS